MFLRLLFVFLIALNIAVGAWLVLGQPYAHGSDATDSGVPELRLLSELPAGTTTNAPAFQALSSSSVDANATMTPVSAASPDGDGNRCFSLGPFATPQDLRNARLALASQTARMRSRQEQTTQTSGWWVYLPAVETRAQALEEARQLAAHHIDDYFVVSSGGQSNTVSLGLFKDPANASKRRDEIVAAGFPASMSERTDTVPEYWLDLVLNDGSHFDWRSRVHAAGVGAHSDSCF